MKAKHLGWKEFSTIYLHFKNKKKEKRNQIKGTGAEEQTAPNSTAANTFNLKAQHWKNTTTEETKNRKKREKKKKIRPMERRIGTLLLPFLHSFQSRSQPSNPSDCRLCVFLSTRRHRIRCTADRDSHPKSRPGSSAQPAQGHPEQSGDQARPGLQNPSPPVYSGSGRSP